jgi:protein-disulfide isomerase
MKKTKKVLSDKDKKELQFNIIFISISLALFFLLILLLSLFKSSLYLAKDEVADEVVTDYLSSSTLDTSDPLITGSKLNIKDLDEPLDTKVDPTLGNQEAKVTIFYFSDYSCSYCFQQQLIIKNIYDKFKESVRIIWKDYPENSLDSFSFLAAKAARCANEQGKFWDYNQLLYENKESFPEFKNQLFLNLADKIKLNRDSFSQCLSSTEVDQNILENMTEAESLGIMGIPYIYVNDQNVLGSVSEEELESIIESELKE